MQGHRLLTSMESSAVELAGSSVTGPLAHACSFHLFSNKEREQLLVGGVCFGPPCAACKPVCLVLVGARSLVGPLGVLARVFCRLPRGTFACALITCWVHGNKFFVPGLQAQDRALEIQCRCLRRVLRLAVSKNNYVFSVSFLHSHGAPQHAFTLRKRGVMDVESFTRELRLSWSRTSGCQRKLVLATQRVRS